MLAQAAAPGMAAISRIGRFCGVSALGLHDHDTASRPARGIHPTQRTVDAGAVMEASTNTTPHRGGGRIIAAILGVLLSLIALGVAVGGAGLVIAQAVYEHDGFLTSPPTRVSTDTYALVSEPFDIDKVDDWKLGKGPIRLRVRLNDTDHRMFVGVARADEVKAALDGAGYATVHDIGDSRVGDVTYKVTKGGDLPKAPAELVDWESQASGSGELAATWTPHDGRWVIVAMNEDGSAGIGADARLGARIPGLTGLAWGLLVLGIVLGGLAALLIIYGVGGRGTGRGAGTGAGTGAGGELTPTPTTGTPLVAGAAPSSPAMLAQRPLAPGAVRVDAIADPTPSRWLWLVKWLLLIPHYVVLALLFVAFVFLTIIAWFAIVFTGRYPRGLFDFNLGVLRWSWRVSGYAYGALATDRYPPFTLGPAPDYPVQFDIAYPERLSRLLPFVKWALASPHLLLIGAAAGGVVIGTNGNDQPAEVGIAGLLSLFLAIGLLFTGRLPGGLFSLLIGLQRWAYRTVAYLMLLTDAYPPFRLDQGGIDPGPGAVAAEEPQRVSPQAAEPPAGPM
jgi:hypothetical protein